MHVRADQYVIVFTYMHAHKLKNHPNCNMYLHARTQVKTKHFPLFQLVGCFNLFRYT